MTTATTRRGGPLWHGDIPVGVSRAGKTRLTRGRAVWVSDVFAWLAGPAAWNENLSGDRRGVGVLEPEDLKKLRRLGDNPPSPR
jgi:hypothetical protein